MYVTPLGISMVEIKVFLKVLSPILVMFLLIVAFLRLIQPENAAFPRRVTLSGISISSSRAQPKNASLPIYFMLSGIVIAARVFV